MKTTVQFAFSAALGFLMLFDSAHAQNLDRSFYGQGDASGNRVRLTDEHGKSLAYWDGAVFWFEERGYVIEQSESVFQLISLDGADTLGRWTHWSKYFQIGQGLDYFLLADEGNPKKEHRMAFKRPVSEGGTLEILYRVDQQKIHFEILGARSMNEALYFFAVLIDRRSGASPS